MPRRPPPLAPAHASTVRPAPAPASAPRTPARALRLAAWRAAAAVLREAMRAAMVTAADVGAALDLPASRVEDLLVGDRAIDLGQLATLRRRLPVLAPALAQLCDRVDAELARCAA